jgi:hypothetical protein
MPAVTEVGDGLPAPGRLRIAAGEVPTPAWGPVPPPDPAAGPCSSTTWGGGSDPRKPGRLVYEFVV